MITVINEFHTSLSKGGGESAVEKKRGMAFLSFSLYQQD